MRLRDTIPVSSGVTLSALSKRMPEVRDFYRLAWDHYMQYVVYHKGHFKAHIRVLTPVSTTFNTLLSHKTYVNYDQLLEICDFDGSIVEVCSVGCLFLSRQPCLHYIKNR